MSDLLNIGASGVRAYQTALTTTSENIANASTPGYSRRSATIEEIGRTNSISLGQTIKLTGAGSTVTGIARASDEFRAAEARSAGADLAKTETTVGWIDRIEGALTGNQLTDRFTTFFASAKGVAADPAAIAPRTVLLEDARSLAAGFQSTGRALAAAADELVGQGSDMAKQLTDLGQSIVRINRGLTRAAIGSTAHSQLLDERDKTLESMSALVDVGVGLDDFGRATVRAGGNSGPVIADVEGSALVSLTVTAAGETNIFAHRSGPPQAIEPKGGALAGLADGAKQIHDARLRLNDIATRFVDDMNTWQAAGKPLSAAPAGGYPPFFVLGSPPTEITVHTDFEAGYIAAASAGEGPRGNGNMTALTALRTAKGWETAFDDLTTENAALLATRRNVAEAQGSIHGAAVAARDAATGVDLDEEAVNLIRFQQAYQASSRVIQVARDILQTIIDIR